MSDAVERAKAALEGATDGPWDVVPGAWGNVWHFSDDPGSPPLIVRMGGMSQPDAEFIAQARTLVPELVAEVERLRGLLDRYEPRTEMCQACGGLGRWETECCNGSSGCPCRGGLVEMGACHACGGTGQVEQQRPMANANFILDNHIGYPGGGPR